MPIVKIDNESVIAVDDVVWADSSGTEPVRQEFAVSFASQEILVGKNVTLSIQDDQGAKHEWRNLTVLTELPGDDPFTGRVLLVDIRWTWTRRLAIRKYNMRRRVGVRRRVGWEDPMEPVADPAFRFAYAEYSLNEDHPWKPHEILLDLLTSRDVLDIPRSRIILEPEIFEIQSLPVESLELNDSADTAIQRALELMPGAALHITKDGSVRIYSTLSGKELDLVGTGDFTSLGAAGNEFVDAGHVAFVTNKVTRPKEVHVFFTIEAEVRFDFIDDSDNLGTTDTKNPPLRVDNVAPVPDYKLDMADGTIAYQGEWKVFGDLLRAWKTPSLSTFAPGGTLTASVINKAFIPEMNLFGPIGLAGQLDPRGEFVDWSSRIATIMSHYRQTFRIRREWMNNILELRAELVASLDIVNGTRAPARVYMDYALVPSAKTLHFNALTGKEAFYAVNVDGYPGLNTAIVSTTRVAPFTVNVLDNDQGIIGLSPSIDQFNQRARVFPSKIDNMPSTNGRFSSRATSKAFNAVDIASGGKIPSLSSSQQVAIILTATPAAPNNKKQLYRVIIKPEDVRGLLPTAALPGLSQVGNEIMEIRIGPAVETARIRWTEVARPIIKRIFGVGGTINDSSELKDLVINDSTETATIASLRAISQAVAASIYAEQHDRVQGSMTGRMVSDNRLEGSITDIEHRVAKDGVSSSVYGLPPSVTPISIFSFMDASTRQILLRNTKPQ